jgi:hypothetical protein
VRAIRRGSTKLFFRKTRPHTPTKPPPTRRTESENDNLNFATSNDQTCSSTKLGLGTCCFFVHRVGTRTGGESLGATLQFESGTWVCSVKISTTTFEMVGCLFAFSLRRGFSVTPSGCGHSHLHGKICKILIVLEHQNSDATGCFDRCEVTI